MSLKGLEKVRVGHDSSGPGSGWFLDKVVIKDPEDNTKEYVFPCNRFGIFSSQHNGRYSTDCACTRREHVSCAISFPEPPRVLVSEDHTLLTSC